MKIASFKIPAYASINSPNVAGRVLYVKVLLSHSSFLIFVNGQKNPLDQHLHWREPGEGAGDDWVSGPGQQHV